MHRQKLVALTVWPPEAIIKLVQPLTIHVECLDLRIILHKDPLIIVYHRWWTSECVDELSMQWYASVKLYRPNRACNGTKSRRLQHFNCTFTVLLLGISPIWQNLNSPCLTKDAMCNIMFLSITWHKPGKYYIKILLIESQKEKCKQKCIYPVNRRWGKQSTRFYW